MNSKGQKQNLVARQTGNTNAVRHGAHSRRVLAPRTREVADALLELPHVKPIDRIGAEELGGMVAVAEALDRDIAEHGVTDAKGRVRSVVALRIRVSGRIERWLREYGATPASRVEWVERVSRGAEIADALRSEIEAGRRFLDEAEQRDADSQGSDMGERSGHETDA